MDGFPYVCRVIYNVSKDEYFTCPRNETEWLEIAQAFEDQWQMPYCLGAGDGKRFRIKCPKIADMNISITKVTIV